MVKALNCCTPYKRLFWTQTATVGIAHRFANNVNSAHQAGRLKRNITFIKIFTCIFSFLIAAVL